ncbi:hypothetical protein ABBQ38_006662 [Trebouxia sp. C0009 RCD-2024]
MHRLFLNVGYELSEQQLRPYFSKFGAVTDLYLPKHKSGRNKGYGFLTYATKSALLSASQKSRHFVGGRVVQVKLAGPRPVRESRPLMTPCTDRCRDSVRGHRLYVGGLAKAVTQEGIWQHFAKWGKILDVYIPNARDLSKCNYCFVTFDNAESAHHAYRQSERSIDGWPLKSISVAEDRKDDGHQEPLCAGVIRNPSPSEAPAAAALQMPLASDSAKLHGYVSWLELRYQQAVSQLATEETMGLPAAYSYSGNLPDHSYNCSDYPLGLQSLAHSTDTSQMDQSAPAAYMNSFASKQAVEACQNWIGMSLPGSSAECSGESDGFAAGLGNALGNTDTSLSLDHLAMLAVKSVLEASSHDFSGGGTVHQLMLIDKSCCHC